MKTLILMRHAKSSRDNPALADHDRPLNDRGLRDSPRMGKLIKKEIAIPDLILSSTAKRALDTATLVAESCGYEKDVQKDPLLYEARLSTFYTLLNNLDDSLQSILLVGHNPEMEQLVTQLSDKIEPLPTAAVVHLELPITDWKKFGPATKAEIISIYRPKEI